MQALVRIFSIFGFRKHGTSDMKAINQSTVL